MGLLKSLNRRVRLAKGEPLDVATKVFFSGRSFRRDFEMRKNAELQRKLSLEIEKAAICEHQRREPISPEEKAKLEAENKQRIARDKLLTLVRTFIDSDWYSSVHDLDQYTDSAEHFIEIGLSNGYAPSSHLSSIDGVHLTHWANEFLFRSGIPLGDPGLKLLPPDEPNALNPLNIKNTNNKKIAVVSAIFGGYDKLLPVDQNWAKETDFFIFSDRAFENLGPWQQVHANYDHPDPRRRARFIKTHLPTYFQAYDLVIWVDGNILICSDPREIALTVGLEKSDFATFRHPDRGSLISEAAACIRFGKDDPHVLGRHLSQIYERSGLNEALLFESMVCLMRPNSTEVRIMCSNWWKFIMKGSKRDQLSLPVAVCETSLKYSFIPGNIHNTPHFAKIAHRS